MAEEIYLNKFKPEEIIKITESISSNPWLSDGLLKKLGISILDISFSKETPYHYHKNTQEVFRFHNLGEVVFEGKEFEVGENSILYVPIEAKHKLVPILPSLKATLITVPKFDPSDEYIVN